MQTINLKITKKMNCGSCSGTVRATLEELDFVVSATVDLETQTATVEVQDGACKCVKKDGLCPCGANCQCAQAAMRSALKAVGYTSEVTNCGASGAGKPCPAQALGTCTCGPDCQCGDDCQCPGCPAYAAVPDPGDNLILTASVATGLIAIGYIWAKWKYAESLFS